MDSYDTSQKLLPWAGGLLRPTGSPRAAAKKGTRGRSRGRLKAPSVSLFPPPRAVFPERKRVCKEEESHAPCSVFRWVGYLASLSLFSYQKNGCGKSPQHTELP